MNFYEKLQDEACGNGVDVCDYPFSSDRIKGLYCNGTIAINKNLTNTQKACVLAEELGHYYTSTGDILDQSDPAHRKQERHARLWGYNRTIGLSGIIHGYRKHCRNQHELAECLHVSEEYLQEAIACYRDKYGCSVEVDGYLIVFEPCLAVYERFENIFMDNTPQGLL